MRTLVLTSLLTAMFVVGAAFGWADTASAAPAQDDDVALAQVAATLGVTADDLSILLDEGGEEVDGRRHPRLRRARARILHALRTACPCNGPDGEGWDDHAAFVECVSNQLDSMENLPDELKAKLLAKAEASQVGEEGFECPTREDRPERPERPAPGGRDTP